MSIDGIHSGGPFSIRVSPKMRVEELRNVIRDVGGVLPALQVRTWTAASGQIRRSMLKPPLI